MPRDEQRAGRAALGWAARAMMLLGGVTLAVRLGVPAPAGGRPEIEQDESKTGRGQAEHSADPASPAAPGTRRRTWTAA